MTTSRKSIDYCILAAMVVSIALENIKLFSVLGTAFKPTHVIFIAAILRVLLRGKIHMPPRKLFVLLFFIVLPMLPLYRISETQEWFKSYVIWLIGVFYLVLGQRYYMLAFRKHRKKLIRLLIHVILVTQVLAVVQFILTNFFHYEFLRNPFGIFQYYPSFISRKSGFSRAYSVFHEASVLGWVNSTQFALLLFTKKEGIIGKRERIVCYGLCVAAMLVSVSATAMFLVVGIYLLYLILNAKKKITVIQIFAGIVAFIAIWNFTDILAPLKRLTEEYDLVHSSGYERFNTPMQYAIRTLEYYPLFGRGIGIEGNVDKVGWIKDALAATANNSVFQVVMNFGLSSVFLFIALFSFVWRTWRRNKNYLLMLANLLGVLISTGAYLSMDFLVVLNITVLVFQPARLTEPSGTDAETGRYYESSVGL